MLTLIAQMSTDSLSRTLTFFLGSRLPPDNELREGCDMRN